MSGPWKVLRILIWAAFEHNAASRAALFGLLMTLAQLASKTAVAEAPDGEAIYAASWSSDGREIIATLETGDAIRTFDAQTGKRTSRRFPGHTGRFTISQISTTHNRLVSFSTDSTLRVFDYKSGQEILKRTSKINYLKTC